MNIIKDSKKFFILGIKGVAMANIALILKKMGKNVVGSDTEEHFITDKLLESQHIPVLYGFKEEDIPDNIDVFIYSAAHKAVNNPQAIAAQKKGVRLVSQPEFLGELLEYFKTTIAVAGCHGKTTTSSLLAYSLKELGVDPSYLIGTSTFNQYWGGDYASKEYFVLEADEYGVNPPLDKTPKLHFLHPSYILCTNIDFDHPDVYSGIQETQDVFAQFFLQAKSKEKPRLFFCKDNEYLMQAIRKISKDEYETFGYNEDADLVITNAITSKNTSSFQLHYKGRDLGEFTISLFGKHNISNASGVVLTLLNLGFNSEKIMTAIKNFTGAKRRFEEKAFINDIYLFDDYAHHPEEISSTILSAKERFKGHRVVVIFQPHTFSRTNTLKNEFVEALSSADYAFIAPIFASARERKEDNPITSDDLISLAKEKGYTSFATFHAKEELMSSLKKILAKGDIVFTIGAGDVYKLKNDIIEVLKAKN